MQEVQEGIICGFCGSSLILDAKSFGQTLLCQKCQRKYSAVGVPFVCSCCFSPLFYIRRQFNLPDAVICSNPDCPLYQTVGHKLVYKDVDVLRIVDTERGEKIVSAMPDTAFDDFCRRIRPRFLLIPVN